MCRKMMTSSKGTEDILEQLSIFLSKNRWGELTYKELDLKKGLGKIEIRNSLETKIKIEGLKCNFLQGFIAGFFTELSGSPFLISENKCIGNGDPYCELSLQKEDSKSSIRFNRNSQSSPASFNVVYKDNFPNVRRSHTRGNMRVSANPI